MTVPWYEPFLREDRLHTSESDVLGRQILTYVDGPRAKRINLFLVVEDPYHGYSNEAKRA